MRAENVFSFWSAWEVLVVRSTKGFAVATCPAGKPFSSGSTARVRSALWPAPLPTGSPAWMRRRASALGTASVKLRPVFWRKPSKLPKKNVLLRSTGPPMEPPNWSTFSFCFLPSYLLAESRASSRLYSKAEPLKRLPPLLLTTVMLPPAPRPLSAGARPELTRNSATDSIEVCSRNCEPVAFR